MSEWGVEAFISEKARPWVKDEDMWKRLDHELDRVGATDIEHHIEYEAIYESYNENGYGIGEPIGYGWRFQAVGTKVAV